MRPSITAAVLFALAPTFPTCAGAPLRYVCTYATFVDAEGKGLEPANGFKLKFAMDRTDGKAFMIGSSGVVPVQAHIGAEGVTFLEFLPTGAVQSTTITAGGLSVHSRHSMMMGRMIASQYYGKCQ